jgi:hypothetical protein
MTSWQGSHRKHRSSIAVYGPLPSNGCNLSWRLTFDPRVQLRITSYEIRVGKIISLDQFSLQILSAFPR